eukprot:scaffold234397_cov33-Tisochrysis_lutea.AAC.4
MFDAEVASDGMATSGMGMGTEHSDTRTRATGAWRGARDDEQRRLGGKETKQESRKGPRLRKRKPQL